MSREEKRKARRRAHRERDGLLDADDDARAEGKRELSEEVEMSTRGDRARERDQPAEDDGAAAVPGSGTGGGGGGRSDPRSRRKQKRARERKELFEAQLVGATLPNPQPECPHPTLPIDRSSRIELK